MSKMWIKNEIKGKKNENKSLPIFDIRQPYTWSQLFSEQSQFDIQSNPYQGKTHFELQFIPTYPFSHAGNKI